MTIELAILLIFLAMFCEYVDSTFGMGYGTIMTPVLLLMGYEPLQLVPIVLLSEMLTGMLAGLIHHKVGNFSLYEKNNIKILSILSACSVVGAILAVSLAVILPKFWIKLYIALLILSIGIFMFLIRNKTLRFSLGKIWWLGLLGSFNKGISAGGYGPLVCSGQILAGVSAKTAVAITSLAEAVTCVVGILLYVVLTPEKIETGLLLPIVFGGLASVPLAANSVRIIPEGQFRKLIAVATLILGALLLWKVF